MNINTDFDDVLLSEKANRVLLKLKYFIRTRLKALEDEIDAESGEIIVRFIPSGIEFKNFSNGLLEKMKSCISDEDFMYASAQIMEEESP